MDGFSDACSAEPRGKPGDDRHFHAGSDSSPGRHRASHCHDRPAEVATRFVVRLVACAMSVDTGDIMGEQRGTAEVAKARHVAMYLLHTFLSIPYGDVGAMFARDRTTVSHACRIVEDLRDDPMHDDFIARLEEMVELARSMATTNWQMRAASRAEPGVPA
jgi:hypothetical protein